MHGLTAWRFYWALVLCSATPSFDAAVNALLVTGQDSSFDFRRGVVPHDRCPDGVPAMAGRFARRIRALSGRAPLSHPGHLCPGRNPGGIVFSDRFRAGPT